MMVTVVYDNSEATELCAAQHLYLKPIAKLMISVLLPETTEPVRPFSNWEVLDQLKSLICPDQFTTVRLSKSTKDFIRFEGEAETRSLVQILKAKLHGKIIKLNGLKTDLKVVATDAQGEWEPFPKEKEASLSDGGDEQDVDKSPDSIYFEGLPCKWFAPKGSNGEKPCEEILRVVFESFGKIKNVDIPMLDPYREVMTGGSFGGFSFGLQTFEAFIQYQESTDFVKAMESLQGMKLMLKGDDGKALACNMKVMFDTTKHFSERAIRRRNQERLKLQELEEERKKEKKREEEETERKRKEEERKAQEKRKKARVRRRALKERDRPRQRRQKDRAKAETPQEPDSSEEWEERKYLLAQRRVEALRLLQVLLRKIAVRLFASHSSLLVSTHLPETQLLHLSHGVVNGSSPFSSRDIDTAAQTVLGDMLQRPRKDLNTMYLQNCGERPEYLVAQPDNEQNQSLKKRAGAYLLKPSHFLGEKRIKSSARNEGIGKLFSDDYDDDLPSDQTSLKITIIKGPPLEKEDYHSSGQPYSCRLSERAHSRRQKIYETDEFTDYLLNYYQSPKYSRICLEPGHVTGPYQWQRAVLAKGNGLLVNLRKPRCPATNLRQMQILKGRKQVEEEDYWTEVCRQACEAQLRQRRRLYQNVDYTKEFTKEFQIHFKDTVSETSDQLSPTAGQNHLLEKTYASEVGDSKSTSKSQVSSPNKSADVDLELTDFLEEISSDSECFSEILSINGEKEVFVTRESGSSEKGSPPNAVIPCDKEISSSHRTFYSKWKQNGDDEYSKYKLRKQERRSRYEMRYSRLELKNNSSRYENNSRRREVLAPRYFFDRGYYHESNSNNLLNDVTRKRKWFRDNQSMNYRPSRVPVFTKRASAFHMRNFPRRREIPWKSEYNQDRRRFRQHENYKDFMMKSDNYYIRHNHQGYFNCNNYLRNNTNSLYFQMF
ncbi:A-kinase anchor protein 17B [Galemys pyrenaicus]|uniref:A-kinase anchor protein 17B n=1 Tax=Galemys pyrenaicus TaxID=202257 RepID=A0A8J5ZZN8_GALPY|nr:A-kinase anchor protein 17B [Galemys pyrenaicus]